MGTKQKVWANERAYDGKHLAAHNKCFVQVQSLFKYCKLRDHNKQVLVDANEVPLGSHAEVEIVSCCKFSVSGRQVLY